MSQCRDYDKVHYREVEDNMEDMVRYHADLTAESSFEDRAEGAFITHTYLTSENTLRIQDLEEELKELKMLLIAAGIAKVSDTVPAMLTPGELVLNKEQQKALLTGG